MKNQTSRREIFLITAVSLFYPIAKKCFFSDLIKMQFAKIIRQGHSWDQSVSREKSHKIQQWLEDFQTIPLIDIPRCLVPNVDGTHEIHNFSEVSISAVAVVVCMRIICTDGTITASWANASLHYSTRWAFPNWSLKQLEWETNWQASGGLRSQLIRRAKSFGLTAQRYLAGPNEKINRRCTSRTGSSDMLKANQKQLATITRKFKP